MKSIWVCLILLSQHILLFTIIIIHHIWIKESYYIIYYYHHKTTLLTDLPTECHTITSNHESSYELQGIKCKWQKLVLTFEAKHRMPIPLQHSATSGGWGGYVSVRDTVALIEVGTANIVNWSRREVLWWIFWPAKLLLGFTVNLDWIKHGDAGWVNRCSNF